MMAQPDDHPKHMTQAEREALPWYGGNKIPDSYLNKFIPERDDNELPSDLRAFLLDMRGMTNAS